MKAPPPVQYFKDEDVDLQVLDKLVLGCVRDLFAPHLDVRQVDSLSACSLPGLCEAQRQERNHGASLEEANMHRIVCENARSQVLVGNILGAIELARGRYGGNGEVLEDKRILFKLYKQQFVELAQSAATTDDTQHALNWCRENLAPVALEAYPEAYDEFKHAMLSVVSCYGLNKEDSISSLSNRKALAGALSRAMKKVTRASQPQLILILRHLLVLHKVFSDSNFKEAYVECRDSLSFKLVDSCDEPMLPEEGVLGCFPEGDVLTLRDAASITNQEAIEALKHTQGDIHFALRNELARVRLKEDVLEEILVEYCVYRGLFDEDEALWEAASGLSPLLGKAYRRRKDASGLLPHEKMDDISPMGGLDRIGVYAQVRNVSANVARGEVASSIAELERLSPGLMDRKPELTFELKRLELLERLRSGDEDAALCIAREELQTLAQRDLETLLPILKKTMVAFIHGNGAGSGTVGGDREDAEGVMAAVSDLVATAMGLGPPRLVILLKSLLRAHRIWYQLEMCKDRFEDVLGICHLKGLRGAAVPEGRETCGAGEEDGGARLDFPECSILSLMEIISSTRAQAIELLMQHEGSLEQCLESVFG